MEVENSEPDSDLTVSVLPQNYQEADDDQDLHPQECQDFIDTLPTVLDYHGIQLCQYQGFWYPKRIMHGVLQCQNHFQALHSDFLLISFPKSGITWLKALVFSIINRKTHYPDPTRTSHHPLHPLLTSNPHALVPFLEIKLYLQQTKPDLSSFPAPRIFASHFPYISLSESAKQVGCKIVYLCRNPKDIFASLWHFRKNIKPETKGSNSIENFFEEFCGGVSSYGPFWDHMLGYYKESLERPGKIKFLRFEELKNEPVKILKELAEFLGHGFSKEEEEENGDDDVVNDILKLCSFENLSNLEVNKNGKSIAMFGVENRDYFIRGVVGDWKNHLTFDMAERLDVISQEKLAKHGLKI
ncbi:cytosolic sulfotransferase 5-like [Prosopis cineraria]|uniref:cytosolic sulfotransferase 5-like n=1 Tax=Prosopis cineraria TaxID=364024 RepID=UPI00241049CE|nr:cytosolic sulfotransferase 5-like [Prosopis cineraria]XP_054776160.1 cytosolic sulfotransferase 5-like [Prosopis cineraria]XP_054776161.1 cytosolic sulfotransferase 5-like [Prosopis cineraria]